MKFTRLIIAPTLAIALSASGAFAQAEHVERTTEKTTTYNGVVSDVNPTASTIILKSETQSAPTTYVYNKETVFVDSQGKIVTYETVKNSPVTISYVQDGDRMIVTKVAATAPQVRKETTTTTTETR